MLNQYVLKTSIACLVISLIAGCASAPERSSPKSSSKAQLSVPAKPSSKQHTVNYHRLQAQYQHWKGTPYSMGGLNKKGIDCSGFVYVTFRDVFGMEVPRSTEGLAEEGTPVTRQQLHVGDLVFFKTGFSKHHVGIYIGDQQFIHASTSRGVMKSSLSNPYWTQHYWKSARILSN